MNGLELSQYFYESKCKPMIKKQFSQYEGRIAIGLVGEGSECFGFDDEISRDHDFFPSVCVWVNKSDYKLFGNELSVEVNNLLKEVMHSAEVNLSEWGSGRRGVFEIGEFYKKYIGTARAPETLADWRRIPEVNLSVVTNGKVFTDPLGEFSKIRQSLLEFYPEDIRLKKIAARCMKIAQSGQYNYPRSIKRNEYVAARMAESEFIDSAISLVYLLNKKYKPFYKWMHKGLSDLPILGRSIYGLLSDLVSPNNIGYNEKINNVEEICTIIIKELQDEKLSDSQSDFILDHGPVVHKKIKDELLANTSPWDE